MRVRKCYEKQGVRLGAGGSGGACGGAGLGSRCTTPIRSNLGGLASLETHCRISQGNEVLLTQIVAMALGQRAMYSLVYTASPANSVVYRQSYLRTRASLVLR